MNMAKEEKITLEGQVVDVLPNTMFKVKLDMTGQQVIGYISGKMRQHDIKILLGDSVIIEFSLYDLTRGRILRRK
jgi:translation initiation factor IF-1